LIFITSLQIIGGRTPLYFLTAPLGVRIRPVLYGPSLI